mmetsp:Transcript_43689/g.103772  ORF Transcript_43689/g.103772 Transcript_43689/m.103772 type:complete len:500 (+) Transcript_43689:223-1722(+)
MSWQNQYQHRAGPSAYGGNSDPYMMAASWGTAVQSTGDGDIHDDAFLSSGTTRDSEALERRKAEHMESAEHIAPQHSYPGMPMHKGLNEKVLREHFHLPLTEVAKKFGMCTTAFKKLCRKQGIMQWPHRTLRSLEKKIASLCAEQKFTNDHNLLEDQIRKLQQKRESILSGNVSALDAEELLASDDSSASSAGASGRSSPRAAEVMGALHLDDSASSVASGASSTSLPDEKAHGLRQNRSLSDLPSEHGPHMHGPHFPRPGSTSSGEQHEDAEAYHRRMMHHRASAGAGEHSPEMPGMYSRMHPGYPSDAHMQYPMRWWGPEHAPGVDPTRGGYGYPVPMMRPAPYGRIAVPAPSDAGQTGALRHQISVLMEENASLRAMIHAVTKDREEMARANEAAVSSAMGETANYRHMYLQLEAQMQQMAFQGNAAGVGGSAEGRAGGAGASPQKTPILQAQHSPGPISPKLEEVQMGEGGAHCSNSAGEHEDSVLHQSFHSEHI